MRIVRISTRITITALAVAVTACGLVRVGPDEALVEAAEATYRAVQAAHTAKAAARNSLLSRPMPGPLMPGTEPPMLRSKPPPPVAWPRPSLRLLRLPAGEGGSHTVQSKRAARNRRLQAATHNTARTRRHRLLSACGR